MSDDKSEMCNSTLTEAMQQSEGVCPTFPDSSISGKMEVEINQVEINQEPQGSVHCGECKKIVEEDGQCLSCDICKIWYHNRCNRNPLPPELYNLLSVAPDNVKWFCDGCLNKPKWKRIFESSYSDYEDGNDIPFPTKKVAKGKKKKKNMPSKKIKTEPSYENEERGNQFSCDICKKTFMSESSMLSHKKSHFHALPYVCYVCNRGFPHMGGLISHKKSCTNDKTHSSVGSQHKDKPHKCDKCGIGFSSGHELKMHLIVNHSKDKSIKKFSCSICERKFFREDGLQRHMRTHTNNGGKEYDCDKCSEKFYRRADWKTHQKMHNIKEHICELCGDKCSDSGSLKKHIMSHSNGNEYVCSHCDYKGPHRTTFQQHMIAHFELKPFACPICEFGFFTQTSLNCHMHKHAAKKQYICQVCGKDCRRSHILKVHMSSHTAEEIRAQKSDFNKFVQEHSVSTANSNSKEKTIIESKITQGKDIVPVITTAESNVISDIHLPKPNLFRKAATVTPSHASSLITAQSNMNPNPSLRISSSEGGGVHIQNYSNSGHSKSSSINISSQNDLPYYHNSSQDAINDSGISQNHSTLTTTNPQNMQRTPESLHFVRNVGRSAVTSGSLMVPTAQYYNSSGHPTNLTYTVLSSLGEMERRTHTHHLDNVNQFH